MSKEQMGVSPFLCYALADANTATQHAKRHTEYAKQEKISDAVEQ